MNGDYFKDEISYYIKPDSCECLYENIVIEICRIYVQWTPRGDESSERRAILFFTQILGFLEGESGQTGNQKDSYLINFFTFLAGGKGRIMESDCSIEYPLQLLILSLQSLVQTTPTEYEPNDLLRLSRECSGRAMKYRLKVKDLEMQLELKEEMTNQLQSRVSDHVNDIKLLSEQLSNCRMKYEEQMTLMSDHLTEMVSRVSDQMNEIDRLKNQLRL
ncbi:hypothetical protein ACOME3_003189 [Neoechinorhynchus agilis]